jgi:hypothetical protein
MGEWDPATDPHLPAHFSADERRGKAGCRSALQWRAKLPVRAESFLVGVISRFNAGKGVFVAEHHRRPRLMAKAQEVMVGKITQREGDPPAVQLFAGGAQPLDREPVMAQVGARHTSAQAKVDHDGLSSAFVQGGVDHRADGARNGEISAAHLCVALIDDRRGCA